MSHYCRTSQKTIPITAVPKNPTIDPMYSGGFCTRRKKTAVIVQISCSEEKTHPIVKIMGLVAKKRKPATLENPC